ncbi:MAG: ATP-dependent helicase [Marinobacter sp.]|uniref:ATP-dependent helicase n=1 Tax=Marinobacter sp. TaxID=50741 RepID=UPI00299EA627|nr:ATP-dependent helicase [Marinobacter sp.]MDX1636157.1 ATP-dependent helicase [Marinobacter sp.]
MTTRLPEFLTAEQRAIITAGVEHTLITAVAGSGKTSTLAWRIRYLLEQGQDPNRLMVLMFNRAARQDFQRKLAEVTRGAALALPEVRTYHAMGLRLYRRFVREGYLPAFSEAILSEQEIHFQVWQLLRRLAPEGLQDDIRRNKKDYVETAAGFIDRVKTTLTPAREVFDSLGFEDRHDYLVDLFHGFEQWRKSQARIGYADMLYEPVMAIHQNPPLQRLVANRMDVILVDEYQDTNEIQHLLLRYVAGDRARVTVVGDPDQTIYEFRGAQPAFILSRFSAEFEQPLEQTLTFSFRYGHRVALLANHLIRHNRGRRDVLCHAHHSTPATEVQRHQTERDADTVATLVQAMSDTERQDAAILFRVWSQSVAIELRLLELGLPYRIDSGKGALFSREVAAVTALLQVLASRLPATPIEDRFELAGRLLRFPHVGLKESELTPLARMLAGFEKDWGQRLLDLDFDALPPLAARKLRRLGECLVTLTGATGPAHDLLHRYAEHTELYEGIRSLAMTHEAASERVDTVKGLLTYLKGLALGAGDALDHLRALRQRSGGAESSGGVLLATIHRTKGLEWDTVILPGLQEKYLPYSPRQADDPGALVESERRLLYVALTRTRRRLHLITPEPGPRPLVDADNSRSRFFDELAFELSCQLGGQLHQPGQARSEPLELDHSLTPVSLAYAERAGVALRSTRPEAVTTSAGTLWQHERLAHTLFGHGSVVGEDEAAFTVRFDEGRTLNFSKKSAHLYFHPLREQ